MSAPSTPQAPLDHLVAGVQIGVMPASLRRHSLNRHLAELIVASTNRDLDDHGSSREPSATATLIDLGNYEMPLYHGDLEADEGQPEAAHRLRDRLARLDGLVIVSPEYNGGPSALLKNTIDWVSRVERRSLAHLAVGLAAATPGAGGGATGLDTTQRIAAHMRLHVMNPYLTVGDAENAFDKPEVIARIAAWTEQFVDFSRAFASERIRDGAAV